MQMDIKTISARKQHSELLQKNTFETPEKRRNNRLFSYYYDAKFAKYLESDEFC